VARFYIENFGCRAAQADGAAMERQFLDRGFERATTERDAELVVLNTCTVTEGADKDARASIRRLQRQNPECRILVTGCYAQRAPEELAVLPGVSWVVGNSHKHQVAEIAASSPSISHSTAKHSSASTFIPLSRLSEFDSTPVFVGDIFAHTALLAAPVFGAANERTRPNLKVQDGCDNRCSFCVIPYVRGQNRSLPLERVLTEVHALVEAGYREVVISGINLGRWGRDLQDTVRETAPSSHSHKRAVHSQLEILIRAILGRTAIEKLRISSVEPMDWSDELIALMANSQRVAKHAHVPMQSGSDTVLRRMHRKYRPWHYREKILKIRAAMPTAAIGADVMVGFPGETESEFEETRRMIEELPLTYLHVFTYSARPGTPASEHEGQIAPAVAHQRNRILREIASQKKRAFMRSLSGTLIPAITLQSSSAEFTEGLTDNYLKVRIPGRHEANRWLTFKVGFAEDDILTGELVIA
jgi:threonylcarbamoyladenosine tRNA methylthiotransferase MtaB